MGNISDPHNASQVGGRPRPRQKKSKPEKEKATMNFPELLAKRRSVRDYQNREVSPEVVKDILKDTCFAPSSGNGQPWQFIVVNHKEWVHKLSDESKKNFVAAIEKDPNSPLKKYEANLRSKDFNVFYNAPCLVYIGGPKDIRSLHLDCSLAGCYFMFAATARGLGTCWVNLGIEIRDPEIQKAIGMPADFRIVAPMALGYPNVVPELPGRNQPQILKTIS
jgi:nitroreductase